MRRGTSKTQRKTDFYLNPLPARSFGTKKRNGGRTERVLTWRSARRIISTMYKTRIFFIYLRIIFLFFLLCICNVDLVSLPPNRLFVRLILFI